MSCAAGWWFLRDRRRSSTQLFPRRLKRALDDDAIRRSLGAHGLPGQQHPLQIPPARSSSFRSSSVAARLYSSTSALPSQTGHGAGKAVLLMPVGLLMRCKTVYTLGHMRHGCQARQRFTEPRAFGQQGAAGVERDLTRHATADRFHVPPRATSAAAQPLTSASGWRCCSPAPSRSALTVT